MGEYLATKVAGVPGYQVVPRDQLLKRLRKQKRSSYKACYDQSCQIEIGRELAAQKSLSTKVLRLGSKCVVTIALYDLRKAATERAADATGGCGIGALVRSIESAVAKLALGPRVAMGRPAVRGVVDRKHCPDPGTLRQGEPPPGGSYVWCVDKRGIRNGPAINWHTNGKKLMEGRYRNNKQVGLWTIYHRGGARRSQVAYRGGRKHGVERQWDDNGQLTGSGRYEEGRKTGVWTRWIKGRRYQASTYKNDDLNGVQITYDTTSGEKRSEGDYRQGKRHGVWSYYRSGKLRERGSYVAGVKQGVWTSWWGRTVRKTTYRRDRMEGPHIEWRDGVKTTEGRYRDGKRSGRWTYYGVRGGQPYKQREGTYRAGKMHGRWLTYGIRGLRSEQFYRDGKRDGRYVVYGLDGEPVREMLYREGRLVGR